MSSVLQQTLRGLCFDTGWCYAVFWKLKRQARSVLTWEDAFYGVKADAMSASSMTTTRQGFEPNTGLADMEDPIAFSVSKMSYHVYSVGEGIIGRVAFANKHQWVFSSHDKSTVTDGGPAKRANLRMQPEKYPSGWDQQFAAGIKTIAVIAVPQGVVQLGSTRVLSEDLKLIGHVKALFGTLQNVPGAFLSDFVTEAQRGGVGTVYPMAVPAPQLTLATTPSLPATLGRAPSLPANRNISTAGVGRLQGLLASQPQILTRAHSMPSPSVLGFIQSVPYFQHAQCENPFLESLSHPSFYTINPSCTWAGVEDIQPANMGSTPKVGVVMPPMPSSVTTSTKANTPSRRGVIRHLSLNSKASAMAIPATTGTDSSVTGGTGASMKESELLKANLPQTGIIRHLSLSSKASLIAIPSAIDPPTAGHSLYPPYSSVTRGKGVFDIAIPAATGTNSSVTGGEVVNVEESELLIDSAPPQTGIIKDLSLTSKASPFAVPAVIDPPNVFHSPYPVNSLAARGKGVLDISIPAATGSTSFVTRGKEVNVEESALLKANAPPQTGVIKHLSLTSKASPIALTAATDPPKAVQSPYPLNSSATRGTCAFFKEFEKSEANPACRTGVIRHLSLSSKATPVTKSGATGSPVPQPVYSPYAMDSAASGGKVINGLNMEESENLRTRSKSTLKIESPVPVNGIYVPVFVGGQLSAEQQRIRTPVKESPGLVHEILSLEVPQASSRHSENPLKLDTCRSSIEIGQMGRIQHSVGVGHLNWGRQLATMPGGNQFKGGPEFDCFLRPTEISSRIDRPSIQRGQSMFLPTEQLGVTTIPTEVYQLENSALTRSEFDDRKLVTCSSTDVSCGVHLFEDRSTSCTPKSDSQGKESCSMNDQVYLLPVEEKASESSHLTMQISDLPEPAQQFGNADTEPHRDFSSENMDSHHSIPFGLQCDDYFDSLQSLKPLFRSPERPAAIDCSVYNLFTSELDEFDEFFASLAKAENGKGDSSSQPETVCDIKSNCEVSTYLDIHSCGVSAKGKEKFTNVTTGANASQPLPDWVASEAISLDKEVANRQEDFQVESFVNLQICPETSLPCSGLDGGTDLGCQAVAAMPPPATRKNKTRKKRKKRSRPGQGDCIQQSKIRQKVQEQIQELRTIIPDGASCSIATLLERAMEYANALQMVSQDSGIDTPNTKLQTHAGGTEMGSGSTTTSSDASWVVDIGAEERTCPILVENLSQPGQMLVEMLCQEHAIFLKMADSITGLGFTIMNGVTETRNNTLWAQFVIMGPKDIHRVQVLWSLMQLLGSSTSR